MFKRTGLGRAAFASEELEPRVLLSLVRVGPEFHPDSLTFERQAAPAVAADPDGNFVVAWTNERSYGDGYGIYAQRYDAARAARGAPFQVSTIGGQGNPAVAIDADGDFVITWDDAHNIRARRCYESLGFTIVGSHWDAHIGPDVTGEAAFAYVRRFFRRGPLGLESLFYDMRLERAAWRPLQDAR